MKVLTSINGSIGLENHPISCYFPVFWSEPGNRIAPDTAGSDGRPSKPRVAGSNPAGRAIFLKNSPILASVWSPGAKVQAKKVTGPVTFQDWLTEVRPAPPPRFPTACADGMV